MSSKPEKNEPQYNPAMFRWARERAAASIDEVAHKLKQTPEKIAAWEAAVAKPTVKQARSLAELYDCAFIEFFLPAPLHQAGPNLVPDFRSYRGKEPEVSERGLRSIQIWAEAQRTNALDLFAELGDEPPAFPRNLFSSLETDVDSAAFEVRKAIDFSIDQQLALTVQQRAEFPNVLRAKFEKLGILILKNGSLGAYHARGLCLVHFPLPVIVYGNEAPSAQSFTLAHELAHVLLKKSGIIAPLEPPRAKERENHERWCDRFAAAFLMPQEIILRLFGKPSSRESSISDEKLSSSSAILKVSPHALLIRLVHLGYVDPKYYWEVKKPVFDEEEKKYKQFGRAQYYGTRYKNALGNLYTKLVLEAWANGRITNHNAAQFMGIKNLNHLYDIRNRFGAT